MAVTAGTRLGPYEILALLGAGGMGEVYQARDTRLDRLVALKVLRAHLADDPDRRARFEREAHLISQLNHPHICTVFDVGQSGDTDYLVVEYLEGQTLADRLQKGPLSLAQALDVAIQIAGALDAAHRVGIVHRDLKPANVMLTKGGAKLLDFGLAKAVAPAAAGMTGLSTITVEGTLLGTVQYMAPEQLEGRDADGRADLFSFGAVLYEMLTGRRAFPGESQASVIAAVLDSEPPPLTASHPLTPSMLEHIVSRCLVKDPADRWQTAADLRRALEWIAESAASSTDARSPRPQRQTRSVRAWMVGAAAAGLVVAGVAIGFVVVPLSHKSEGTAPEVTRAFISVAPADELGRGIEARPGRHAVALSPDGRDLVFIGVGAGKQQLYVRALDRLESVPIAGTEGGVAPFFSPDGKSVGFFTGGELRKVELRLGPPVTICRVPEVPYGASWGSDDRIVFARSSGGLWQVPAAGGTPEKLTTLDDSRGEVSHRLPHVLPDGNGVLFTITRNRFPRWDATQIHVYSRRTHTRKMLMDDGADARYVASGHLVYVRHGVLMAAPFSLARMEATGPSVALVDDVMQAAYALGSQSDSGAGQFSVSSSGTLAYVRGGVVPDAQRLLVWVDRTGRAELLPVPARPFAQPRLSPDGQKIAVSTQGMNMDVWTVDLVRGGLSRLTLEGRNGAPVWTPDGTRIVYRSSTVGADSLFWQPADGSGSALPLTTTRNSQVPLFWSPADGGPAFTEDGVGLWVQSLAAGGQPRSFPFLKGGLLGADLSPDGQWLAYASNESGAPEVYLRRYDGSGARQKISIDGGRLPVWRRDGRELFYISLSAREYPAGPVRMMAATVTATPAFTVGKPHPLFEGHYHITWPARTFDVAGDGQRFLMLQEKERPLVKLTEMILVQNWLEEVKQRVPSR